MERYHKMGRKHKIKNAQYIIDKVKNAILNFEIYAQEFNLSKQTLNMVKQNCLINK